MSNTVSQAYLTFLVNDEKFGVPVKVIYEVLEYVHVTRVPNTAAYTLGIINLRDKVLPLIDIRIKLGLPAGVRTSKSRVLIVNIYEKDTIMQQVGVLVDAASDVVHIDSHNLRPATDIVFCDRSMPVTDILDNGGAITMILDINKILSQTE